MGKKGPPSPVQTQPTGASASPPPNDSAKPPPPPVAVTTPNVLVGAQPPINFGPNPQTLTCPHCQTQIITKVVSKPSTKTHLFAVLLCCCVCCLCAWMPYFINSCQNRNHSCPNCGAYLGTYEN